MLDAQKHIAEELRIVAFLYHSKASSLETVQKGFYICSQLGGWYLHVTAFPVA